MGGGLEETGNMESSKNVQKNLQKLDRAMMQYMVRKERAQVQSKVAYQKLMGEVGRRREKQELRASALRERAREARREEMDRLMEIAKKNKFY